MIIPLRQCANGGIKLYSDGLAHACCDQCEVLISQIIQKCDTFGFTYIHKTGYVYSLTDATKPIMPSIFHWIEWTFDDMAQKYTSRLKSLDCDCNIVIVSSLVSDEPASDVAFFGYGFLYHEKACVEYECNETIKIFLIQAITNGWTLYGNGVLARREASQYECYSITLPITPFWICADTGTSYRYISCDCSTGEITSDYILYGILEYAGCDCLDLRELLLTYPSEFAVDDVSFGDDTVYTRDRSASGGSIYTYSCLRMTHSYDSDYCDYRNMYVIFDNTLIGMQSMNGNYLPDMFLLEFDIDGRYMVYGSPLKYVDVADGTIYFEGHIEPFTTSEAALEIWPHGSGLNWKGLTIRWTARNSNNYWGGSVDSYYSQADAQAELDRLNNLPNKYGYNSFDAYTTNSIYYYEPKASVLPPNFTTTHVEGRIEYNQNTDMWDVYAPHDEFGSGDDIVYNINFAPTNKGFIVNGRDGYSEMLDIAGFVDSIPYWTSPPAEQDILDDYEDVSAKCGEGFEYEVCPEGSVKEIGLGGVIREIPMYDMTYIIQTNESMGGCHDSEWWDAIMSQYDDESASESDSGEEQ